MCFRTVSQGIKNDPRLNSRESLGDVDLENSVHILRKIQNDCYIAALAGQTRARPPRQHGSAVLSACGYRRNHIRVIARDDQADGNLPVI
jgi:hypothetical protein